MKRRFVEIIHLISNQIHDHRIMLIWSACSLSLSLLAVHLSMRVREAMYRSYKISHFVILRRGSKTAWQACSFLFHFSVPSPFKPSPSFCFRLLTHDSSDPVLSSVLQNLIALLRWLYPFPSSNLHLAPTLLSFFDRVGALDQRLQASKRKLPLPKKKPIFWYTECTMPSPVELRHCYE
jgi:hypothetical protein